MNDLNKAAEDASHEVYLELARRQLDVDQLEGKTIKSAFNDWSSLTIIMDDGTYIVCDTDDGQKISGLQMPVMEREEGHRLGLVSEDKYKAWKKAQRIARAAYAKSKGAAHLKEAIAHIGVDGIKDLLADNS
jgi:hypothetical protein